MQARQVSLFSVDYCVFYPMSYKDELLNINSKTNTRNINIKCIICALPNIAFGFGNIPANEWPSLIITESHHASLNNATNRQTSPITSERHWVSLTITGLLNVTEPCLLSLRNDTSALWTHPLLRDVTGFSVQFTPSWRWRTSSFGSMHWHNIIFRIVKSMVTQLDPIKHLQCNIWVLYIGHTAMIHIYV